MGTLAIWAPISFCCLAIIFLGMLDLASLLSQPFGDDSVDFPLNYWILDFSENMSALMDYEHDGAKSDTPYDAEIEDERKVKTRLALSMQEVEAILGWSSGAVNKISCIRPAEVIPQKVAPPVATTPQPASPPPSSVKQTEPLLAHRSPEGYSPLHYKDKD